MADQRVAILRTNVALGPKTRLLSFSLPVGTAFPFVGGKYIIVNTGLPLAGGKIRKRAYSIVSQDTEAASFQIAVRQVGVATDFLHAFTPGQQLFFSGPWGKFVSAAPDTEEITWVLATDTGITAALGLLQAAQFRNALSRTELVWWRTSPEYFLPEALVRERIPTELADFQIISAPTIGDPERIAQGQKWLKEKLQLARPDRVYLAGDGLMLLPWMEMFAAEGVPADRMHLETFFNHAKSKFL